MKIGLIDADLLDRGTKFPNLALMKLSSYFQKQGYETDLIDYNQIPIYDKVFISKVFDFTDIPINLNFYNTVEYGGTGFDYDKNNFLPDKIEHSKPDYSLYQNFTNKSKYYSNHSIGFTTRFCFRQCQFCVNRNKKKVVRWSKIKEFDSRENDYITLLDDNILAHPDRVKIINELQDTKKPFEFKQGIDLRLINDKIAKLLNESKYAGEFIFAFDDIRDKEEILIKLKIWKKYNKKINKFYVLTGFRNQDAQNIADTFERIKILMENKCLAFVMKHKNYKKSRYTGMYITIARWCNQVNFYKKMSFREFCNANGENSSAMRYMRKFKKENPNIAENYFDMKWEKIS